MTRQVDSKLEHSHRYEGLAGLQAPMARAIDERLQTRAS